MKPRGYSFDYDYPVIVPTIQRNVIVYHGIFAFLIISSKVKTAELTKSVSFIVFTIVLLKVALGGRGSLLYVFVLALIALALGYGDKSSIWTRFC